MANSCDVQDIAIRMWMSCRPARRRSRPKSLHMAHHCLRRENQSPATESRCDHPFTKPIEKVPPYSNVACDTNSGRDQSCRPRSLWCTCATVRSETGSPEVRHSVRPDVAKRHERQITVHLKHLNALLLVEMREHRGHLYLGGIMNNRSGR